MDQALPPNLEGIAASMQNMVAQVLAFMPRVAVAILVLIIGWFVARVLRNLLMRAVGRLELLWQRLINKQGLKPVQPRHPPARIVGELVFWLLMLVFITLTTEILGLDIVGAWLKDVVTFLPLAASGIFVVLVGIVLGSLTRDLVASAADSVNLARSDLLGRTAQAIILFTAGIIGVGQIGIDVAFLSMIVGIVLGSMLGALALAFGLGARVHVSNIIASNQLRQFYQVGDKIQVGDLQGRIIDISASRLILETEQGTADIPAKLFDEQVTVVLEKGE